MDCIQSVFWGGGMYVKDLATTVEKAASEGNMKQLYDTTKKLVEK